MLIIQHLRIAIPRLVVLLFTRKSFVGETGISQGHVQQASKSVATSAIVVSPDPLPPTPSTPSATKTSENT
jgi:hypothetical protein